MQLCPKIPAISLDTLSRLKGIETFFFNFGICVDDKSLDTLSRLKGIETFTAEKTQMILGGYFGYAFPFEGN